MDLSEFNRLKDELDKAKREQARKEGKVEELTKKLREVWGCETLEEAKKKLNDLESQEETAVEMFEAALTKFKEKWEDDERIQNN